MTAAIIIPTRWRAGYLRATLSSLMPQARAARVEVLVVDDTPDGDPATRAEADAAGVRLVPGPSRGINGARNAGGAAAPAAAAWLFFLDDDVEVQPGWLAALLLAAEACADDVGFLTGPVHARFEDHPLRACGRELPPITTLDLGPADCDADVAWGVNLGVRRAVLDEVGPWDERLRNGGDEEELQQRWRARRPAGRIRYVAAARVVHRRAGEDARLRSLARAARARGRAARRWDVHRGVLASLRAELRVLAGCAWHVPRRRCANGIVMAALALGRVEEAWAPSPAIPTPGEDDFLSGASGRVGGLRGDLARVRDGWWDVRASVPRAARRLQGRWWRRSVGAGGTTDGTPGPEGPAGPRVLVLAIEQPEVPGTLPATLAELERARTARVTVRTSTAGSAGKFENLNRLLAAEELADYDWLLVVDDDVDLPRGFLDRFLAHAAGAALAQPAHRLHSHAAWPHTRRRPGGGARPTTLVEIGPVTAFHRRTFATLLPFPDVRMGWGLDAHWAALARERGWPMVVVDATPVGHVLRPVAATYPRDAALAEARAFLADRPHLTRDEVR